MTVDRMLPTREAADLLDLTRQLAGRELAPRVVEAEATGTFPAEVFKLRHPAAAGAVAARSARRRHARGVQPV